MRAEEIGFRTAAPCRPQNPAMYKDLSREDHVVGIPFTGAMPSPFLWSRVCQFGAAIIWEIYKSMITSSFI